MVRWNSLLSTGCPEKQHNLIPVFFSLILSWSLPKFNQHLTRIDNGLFPWKTGLRETMTYLSLAVTNSRPLIIFASHYPSTGMNEAFSVPSACISSAASHLIRQVLSQWPQKKTKKKKTNNVQALRLTLRKNQCLRCYCTRSLKMKWWEVRLHSGTIRMWIFF